MQWLQEDFCAACSLLEYTIGIDVYIEVITTPDKATLTVYTLWYIYAFPVQIFHCEHKAASYTEKALRWHDEGVKCNDNA